MENSSTHTANTSSDSLSLDSSAANLSSASSAAAESSSDVGAVQPGRMIPAGSNLYPMLDEGYTEVSDSGAAQAGDLPQSPKETANERFGVIVDIGNLRV